MVGLVGKAIRRNSTDGLSGTVAKQDVQMRIGINTLFYIPAEVGGSETYLRETLKAMARDRAGPFLVLFTNRENDAVLRDDLAGCDRVEFRRLHLRATNRWARIAREQLDLPMRVRRAGIDVLWSPGYTPCCAAPCPQVTSILDMQYKTHPEDLTWLARVVTDVLVKAAVRCSRRLITISEFSASEITRHCSVRPGQVVVTPLAVDADFGAAVDRRTRTAARDTVGLGDQAPFLLCVANSYPHKNLDTLVDGFGRLIDDLPHDLVIVGKPRFGELRLRNALARLPDARRVHRVDALERSLLIALFQTADVFVFPSLYEGFGLPVLEAMSAGTPVVTTRHASLPEVGGEHAFFVDPVTPEVIADAIRSVMSISPSERCDRRNAAREWASRFTWSETAEQTKQAFRRVLASK